MWRFLGGRLAIGVLTLFATTVAVTLLIHLVPGDPVRIMYAQSQGTTPEQLEAIRHNLGLDQPSTFSISNSSAGCSMAISASPSAATSQCST